MVFYLSSGSFSSTWRCMALIKAAQCMCRTYDRNNDLAHHHSIEPLIVMRFLLTFQATVNTSIAFIGTQNNRPARLPNL
jgi:hypothetical protein